MKPEPTVFFIDADTLAKPVTRTLLIAGSDPAGMAFTWSEYAENQANRHLRSGALSVTTLRERLGGRELSPVGRNAGRFVVTAASDRQVLADAVEAGAFFLVTVDVDDFAEIDLDDGAISAVNPDLFMSVRFPATAYQHALAQLVSNMKNPPCKVEVMHSLIAKQHPRLFARHADIFPGVSPESSLHRDPKVLFRGPRCLRCDTVLSDSKSFELGLCPGCRNLS